VIIAVDAYPAIVTLDNRLNDRETQPESRRLRREERLEEMLPNIGGDAVPIVVHCEFDFVVASIGTDDDPWLSGGPACVEAIQDEIQHDLLKFDRVTDDERGARTEQQRNFGATSFRLVLQKPRRRLTDVIQVYGCSRQHLSSHERANARDDRRSMLVLGCDVLEQYLEEMSMCGHEVVRVP
jgi:hypothetical protein